MVHWELRVLRRDRRFRRAVLLLGAAGLATGLLLSRVFSRPDPAKGLRFAGPVEHLLAVTVFVSVQVLAFLAAARLLRGEEARAGKRALRATPVGRGLIDAGRIGAAVLASLLAAALGLGLVALGLRVGSLR